MGSGISIGLTGALAAKYSLQTVGTNIANAATPGYARREVILRPSGWKAAANAGAGGGVTIETVLRRRDAFLESRLEQYSANTAKYSVQQEYLSEIEGFLQEPGDQGINAVLDDFFNQWQAVAGRPQDVTARTTLSLAADRLATRLRDLRSELVRLRGNIFDQIRDVVQSANSVARKVADNNQLITQSLADKGGALSLQDDKDQYMRELAELIGAKNSTSSQQQATVTVARTIIVSAGTTVTIQPPADWNSAPTVGASGSSAAFEPDSGRLGGLIELCRTTIPGIIDRLDQFAVDLMRAINASHAEGLGLNGRFTDLTALQKTSDLDESGDPGDDLLADAGLPFTPTAGDLTINVWDDTAGTSTANVIAVNPQTQSLDDIAAAVGAVDHLSTIISDGKLRIIADSGYSFDFSAEQETNILAALGLNAFFDGKNAADIKVADDIMSDPSAIACARSSYAGDGDNALRISNLRAAAAADGNTISIPESCRRFVVDIGNKTASSQHSLQSSQNLYEITQQQEQSISGVSFDEEATRLLQYQQLFNSCIRYVNAVSKLTDYMLSYL